MFTCRAVGHTFCALGIAGCVCHGLNIGYLERCVEETKFKYAYSTSDGIRMHFSKKTQTFSI